MKNKEKYAEEIMEIAISGYTVAIINGKPAKCTIKAGCQACIRKEQGNCSREKIREWAESEYIDPSVDWSKVPVDTKVLVLSHDGTWLCRYFAKYEDGMVYVFRFGCTSWSGAFVSPYKTAKLAEE